MATIQEVIEIIDAESSNLNPIFPRGDKSSRQDYVLKRILQGYDSNQEDDLKRKKNLDNIKGIVRRYVNEQLRSCAILQKGTFEDSDRDRDIKRAIAALRRISENTQEITFH